MKMRNDEVLINFQVPEIIQRIIDEIDVYVEKGANCRGNLSDMDDCEYDVLLQKLDVISKRYVSGGRLSAAQKESAARSLLCMVKEQCSFASG